MSSWNQQQRVFHVKQALLVVQLALDQRGYFVVHPPSRNTGDCPGARIVSRHTYIW